MPSSLNPPPRSTQPHPHPTTQQFPDPKAKQEQEEEAAAEAKEHPLARATLEEMDEAEVKLVGWVGGWMAGGMFIYTSVWCMDECIVSRLIVRYGGMLGDLIEESTQLGSLDT
jgi:hypothetical protein